MTDHTKVLVDTNVWIAFLREPLPELGLLVKRGRVITHPCVVGELLVGSVKNRDTIREFMLSLPFAREAGLVSILGMIDTRRLFGRGLQWNDIQLLAAAKLNAVPLWTRDRRLADAATEFGVAWTEGHITDRGL